MKTLTPQQLVSPLKVVQGYRLWPRAGFAIANSVYGQSIGLGIAAMACEVVAPSLARPTFERLQWRSSGGLSNG